MDMSLIISAIFFSLILNVEGIMWYLEPNTQKCLREELQSNVLVTGDYEVSEAPGQRVDYTVRDSNGHILSQKDDISKGKFSFVTETHDAFEICFISRVPTQMRGMKQEVSLVIKRGIEARNYEGIGEAAKLKPMEVELKRLEDLSEEIVKDFSMMRKREEEMRDTNESTNNRVFYFSLFSMFCFTWFSNLASVVPQKILQGQETHRVKAIFQNKW